MKDPARTRKLATSQEHLIKAANALNDVDLRRCPTEQRELVKLARRLVHDASTAVDNAIVLDVRTKAAS